MTTTVFPKQPIKVPEFLAWAETQAPVRYELVGGEIVAMTPGRVRHNLVKLAVARALEDAVRAKSLPCTVFTDGVTVVIDDETAREPDASVQCNIAPDLDATTIEAPIIVVEVASPSSEHHDLNARLIEYFTVPSIRHFLIVLPEKRAIVHHQRDEGSSILTRIAHEGEIVLAPPGISVPVAALLGPSDQTKESN